ncbi:3',5'-cyclic-AMP phosphodiesterase [Alcanivorax sp.]|uniref:3',5'-cyclic-AMP phosphodiesterase n=1 Tax=Alcanivorax sp. TaxID=1872427 RepID=UPI002627299B|nr:3',5'-cyclic-AMP phosphodiesterase [Alcanivorax sp.]
MTQQLQPLRVVQLSDCHLFADTQGKLLGLNTQFSLDKVLELIRREQPSPDLILATGDLSQDASLESYQRLGEALSSFTAPVYWLEGNHDKPAPMLKALDCDRERMSPCVLEIGNWTIVMLDSTIPGEVPGDLFDEDLKFLDDALAAANGEHLMVCLHHHPVPMECAWLDTQVVGSAEQFFAVIDRHPRVRAIIWGHVHQEYDEQRNGVRLLAVPSTCVQFKPKSEDFAVDDSNPGYRWLDLYPDGRIDTAVSRVEGITFDVDFSVKGY